MKKILILLILSVLFTLFPLAIIWLEQNLAIGLNPFIGFLLLVLLLLLALGFILWIKKALDKHISFTPDMLFIAGAFSYLNLLLIQGVFFNNSTIDIYLHDTYYVLSYSYPIFIVAIVFVIFAIIYNRFEKIFKRKMKKGLGSAHFWITFLGLSYMLLPFQQIQYVDNPRRYIDYSNSDGMIPIDYQNSFITTLIIVIIVAQLLFIYNFSTSLIGNKK
ncbi:cbb3-type cytochrome c oxidase subunit I [Flavihumibacter sp. RY-1]|uniref:Cbb3-type cytochrome c oxidase subunit I n=1 Tax=Flavihumibacter fluminis TaxID=2909236 RepID=A0ABS9BLT0_9BACT|nr:cbb3-type cytochrome c oxidase subunit I [Flavihumibacter fluminis]